MNRYKIIFFITLTFFLFQLISCSDAEETNPDKLTEGKSLQLTEKICTDFAIKLHESFVNNDSTFLNSYINWEEIKTQTFNYSSENDSILNNIIWGKIKNQIYFGRDFAQVTAMGGSLRFVTYYKVSETEHHIVLRSFYPPQNINFYDFNLGSKGEFLVINDIYSYEMSCSLYTLLGEQMNAFCSLASNEMELLANYNLVHSKLQQAQQLSVEGELSQAYKTLISIDEKFKNTHYYQSIELGLLFGSTDEKVQLNALAKRIQKIPLDEPGRWLLLFYQSGLTADYEQARLCIKNLEQNAGEDEMLTYLIGVTYFEEHNYQMALDLFNSVLATEQDFYIIHYAKITSLIELKKYDLAVESLNHLSTLFDTAKVNWDKEFMAYPEFIMSDEFATFYSFEESSEV